MQIRLLEIENFRGIKALTWLPSAGINFVLGAGDTGKSTLLDAIALVLSPQPSQAALEADYRNMDPSQPFRVKAVVGHLSDDFTARVFPAPLWGWDAAARVLRSGPDEQHQIDPVAVIEVEGTADLELIHRILQPGNEPRILSVQARSAAGLWNVNTNRSPDTQLRMSRGSLLEAALGRDQMRAPAAAAVQGAAGSLQVPEETTNVLKRLSDQMKDAGLDIQELALSLIPSVGQSPVQLLALVAKSADGSIPLASYGRGSRQIAMVTLAAGEVHEAPIAVIDEIEAGLEPYRQRALVALVRNLVRDGGQAFMTTHSPAVLARLSKGEAWRLRRQGDHSIQPIRGHVERLMHRDPEALLSRLPIVCEGATEVGVLEYMFQALAGVDPATFGIHLVDAGGHRQALDFMKAFAEDGYQVGGLVDDESFSSGTRVAITALPSARLFIPPGGRCIECAVANALPTASLESLLEVPAASGVKPNMVDRLQAVSARLGQQTRLPIAEMVKSYGEKKVREAIGEAATGSDWFKSVEAGHELAAFMHANLRGDNEVMITIQKLTAWSLEQVRPQHDA